MLQLTPVNTTKISCRLNHPDTSVCTRAYITILGKLRRVIHKLLYVYYTLTTKAIIKYYFTLQIFERQRTKHLPVRS